MLTEDLIKSQTGLSDLTTEQLSAIVTLANNDTESEVSKRIKKKVDEAKGIVYGRFETDIANIFGVTKKGNEPAHVFLKDATESFKEKNKGGADLLRKVEILESTNSELTKKLENNAGDAELKRKFEANELELSKANELVEQLRGDQDKVKNEYEAKFAKKEEEYQSTILDSALNRAITGLKFKPDEIIPKSVRETFIATAKKGILSDYKTRLVDGKNGDKVLEFLDSDGEILRNPENKREPFTATELLAKSLTDIIDVGQKKAGGGASGGGKKKPVVHISGATTQVEADEIITNKLLSDGLAKGTREFSEAHTKARQEAEVGKLPIGA